MKRRCPNSGSGSGSLVIRLAKEKEQEQEEELVFDGVGGVSPDPDQN